VSLVVLGVLSIVAGFVSLGMVIDALLTTRIRCNSSGRSVRRLVAAARARHAAALPHVVVSAAWSGALSADLIFATTPLRVIAFGLARCCWVRCGFGCGRGNGEPGRSTSQRAGSRI